MTLLLALPLMEESLYQKVYRLPLVKESFSLITEMVMRSTMMVMTMSEWFLGFDEKGKDVYTVQI